MQYVELGRTGLRVSRLGLGTMNFGVHTNEKESHAIMDKALELGINFFDTADRYGGKDHPGRTEQIIGHWLEQNGRRDRVVLATKVYSPMGPGANDRGLSAFHIRRACRASLERLATEHIDLYQMHHVDKGYVAPVQIHDLGADVEFVDAPYFTPGAPWDEIWQAMAALVCRDKISYVGSSNFAAWNIVQACETAKTRCLLGLVSEQSVYNLVNRQVELEVIPACRAYGLGFFCWSPLAGGLLAGAIEKENKGRRARLNVEEELRRKLNSYETLCRDLGESPACVALAWLLSNPVVTAPIIGPRNLEQLDDAVRALDLRLADEVLKQIDEIFPGPGGEAPMAYAW